MIDESSVGMMTFPTEWTIKYMFQTTNWICFFWGIGWENHLDMRISFGFHDNLGGLHTGIYMD